MAVLRQHQRRTFTVIDNDALRNTDLSWRATGMLAYLLSLPDGWKVNAKDLSNRKTDGITAVRSIMAELEDAGHLVTSKHRDGSGRLRTFIDVYEDPTQVDDPSFVADPGKPWMPQPDELHDETSAQPDLVEPEPGTTGTRSVTPIGKNHPGTTEKERPRNPIWDALGEVFGEPTTDTGKKLHGRVTASLKRAGATPEDIIERSRRLLIMWGPESVTLTSLEKHWDRLGAPVAQVDDRQLREYERQQHRADTMARMRNQLDGGHTVTHDREEA